VIEEAAAFVRPLLAQRRQGLRVDLPADLPIIDGDGQRLIQVFVNLLSNASKFAPEASEIRVGATSSDGSVSLWVEDEGPGVSDVDRTALFGRFSRARDSEPAPPGLGLGLWIVKSIIERHGGDIRVERVAGERTRFTVELPLKRAAA
jgi:signal transduction histidine kinase